MMEPPPTAVAPLVPEADLDFHQHSTNEVTHGLHAFAAKCPPPLVTWIIAQWSEPGDYVLDPMAGSGTTLVEAMLAGRAGLALEIDPLARLLCQVKTTLLPKETLALHVETLLSRVEAMCRAHDSGIHDQPPPLPDLPRRDYWFLPEVSAQLALIKQAITGLDVPEDYRRFFYVAFSSLILARTSVANARDIVHSRHHYRGHLVPPDVERIFRQRLVRMMKQMRSFEEQLDGVTTLGVRIVGDDARALTIDDESIDLVVTSPPYCNALDYTRAHMLAVGWLQDVLRTDPQAYSALGRCYIGSDRAPFSQPVDESAPALQMPTVRSVVAEIERIDLRKAATVRRYFVDMWKVLAEIGRVLRPGRHAALIVCPSNIRKISIPTHHAFEEMAQAMELPHGCHFTRVLLRERTISDRRRLMPYMGMEERMRTEYVLVLQKRSP